MTGTKGGKSSPVPLTQICRELIERIPGPGRVKEGLALYFWPRVAGKELAAKAKAERVKSGILWVKCPDPASYNLHFFKKEILQKYRRLRRGRDPVRRIVTGEVADPLPAAEEIPAPDEVPRGVSRRKLGDKRLRLKEAYIRFITLRRVAEKPW